ncbi:MAG: stage II sporulation protein R [Christensenellaceae bacterium]|jgi:stage II sporulation protein R|nr:stage II sporulation protein R [Christensenellaceae bacterium]
MKHVITAIFILGIIAIIAFGISNIQNKQNSPNTESLLRIHIRANSNSISDQDVKYKVKERVVETLSPLLTNISTKKDAIGILRTNIKLIEKTADLTLLANGFNYVCKAEIKEENFPTRVYDGITVPEGIYDALILNLGSGAGDNWWCVVYPPLCFIQNESQKVTYRSIIAEWLLGGG